MHVCMWVMGEESVSTQRLIATYMSGYKTNGREEGLSMRLRGDGLLTRSPGPRASWSDSDNGEGEDERRKGEDEARTLAPDRDEEPAHPHSSHHTPTHSLTLAPAPAFTLLTTRGQGARGRCLFAVAELKRRGGDGGGGR